MIGTEYPEREERIWLPEREIADEARGTRPRWCRRPARGYRAVRYGGIALAWIAACCCLGAIGWVASWLRPLPVTTVILAGSGYEGNLAVPHNAYGWNTLEEMAATIEDGRLGTIWQPRPMRLGCRPIRISRGTDWTEGIDVSAGKTALVYLAMHGVGDGGGAYLLPDDVGVETWQEEQIDLASVLDWLAKLPDSTSKVLVLDPSRMTSAPEMGILMNDFTGRLRAQESKIRQIPNLVVIGASDAHQRSWSSPAWGQTVFGHFLMEGLRGAADKSCRDGRLTVWDLYCYCRGEVGNWVLANRGAVQTPVLLPEGELGRKRARRIALLSVRGSYAAPSLKATAPPQAPKDLVARWRRHDELDAQSPHPFSLAPHAWRSYEQTLLRYEQLVMAGSPWAGRLLDRVRNLESVLHQGEREQSELAHYTSGALLTTRASGKGGNKPTRSAAVEIVNRLWSLAPADREKWWTSRQDDPSADAPGALAIRAKVYDLLVDRAGANAAQDLAKACSIVRLIDDPLHSRPPTAHFLVMLGEHLPEKQLSPQMAEVIQTALEVDGLASRATLSSREWVPGDRGSVWTSIRGCLDRGDLARRHAQDLLFAGEPAVGEARRLLQEAKQEYELASRRSRQINDAKSLRDRALSRLPHLTRIAVDQASQTDDDTLPAGLADLFSLWQRAHQLSHQLNPPAENRGHSASLAKDSHSSPVPSRPETTPRKGATPPSVDGEEAVRRVVATADGLRRGLDRLERHYLTQLRSVKATGSPGVLLRLRALLSAPLGAPETRVELLNTAAQIDRALAVESERKRGRGSFPSPELPAYRQVGTGKGPDPSLSDEPCQAAARFEGLAALAQLGDAWFDACPIEHPEAFAQVQHRLEVFTVADDGSEPLAIAGRQIAARWRAMPSSLTRWMHESRQADVDAARGLLRRADELARHVPPCFPLDETAASANRAYRRLVFRDLMLRQAERVFGDHWFAESSESTPYYQTAAKECLADAAELTPEYPVPPELEQRIQTVGQLAFDAPAKLNLTNEVDFSIRARLVRQSKGEVPAGFPVTWLEADKTLELVPPDAGSRQVRPFDPDHAGPEIPYTLRCPALTQAEGRFPATARPSSAQISLHGFFRGQRIEVTTAVELHPAPDTIVWEVAPPDRATLALRAPAALQRRYGEGTGAVAIVLDASGSMGPVSGRPFTPSTRYAQATRALRSVLAGVPRHTQISLWVFGEAVGDQKTVEQAESTIRCVQPPIAWDPGDSGQLQALMAQVEHPAIEPWNESPILRTMLQAKQDLQGVEGFKSLVVITDGLDNCFADDKGANPKKQSISDVLRKQLQDSYVEVTIIGFRMQGDDATKLCKQFDAVTTLSPPGHVYTIDQTDELIALLEKGLHPCLRYGLRDYAGQTDDALPREPVPIAYPGENDVWFPGGVIPGGYLIRAFLGHPAEQNVVLDAGDALLITLTEHEEFRRLPFAATESPWMPTRSRSGWALSVLQNQRRPDDELQMLAVLERESDPASDVLRLLRPRECWIEVVPGGACQAAPPIRWGAVWGYPASAWRIDAAGWPGDEKTGQPASPRLQVWWNPDQNPAAAATLVRGHDFADLGGLCGRKLSLAADEVTLQTVALEKHRVLGADGTATEQPCLVVRLQHAPGKRFRVRIGGTFFAGQEHRFYRDLGRYTALFWPVTDQQAPGALARLSVVSVDAFKRRAEERGYTITLDQLPPPEPNSTAPSVVLP